MFNVTLNLSGERFKVFYRILGRQADALATARDICVEQTIEFPAELVNGGDIPTKILGQIESFQPLTPECWVAVISYAVEITGFELTQFINVIFGNFSLKPGVRVEQVKLPQSLAESFKGPRFGISGIRELLDIPERPLFCTALKPMGLSSRELSQLAYRFALSGVDMVKDDHGLADQPFAPFKERVACCAAAVRKANRETGGECLYIPNITAPADQILQKALYAGERGAGGLLVAPGLVGFDAMRCLADEHRVALPIISHPAFQGSYLTCSGSGVSHYFLFGQLPRLAGTDAVIFPNYGGRFSFSREDCRAVVHGAFADMFHIKPIFTMPGGGMDLERIPEMLQTYGRDVVFLIGGALHKMGPDLTENCRRYITAIQNNN